MRVKNRNEIKVMMHNLVFKIPVKDEISDAEAEKMAAVEEQISDESEEVQEAFEKEIDKQEEGVKRIRRVRLREKQNTAEFRQQKIMMA